MTHTVSRSLVVAAFSMISLTLATSPVRAQAAPPPPPAPKTNSTVLLAPPQGVPPSRFRPTTQAVRQRTPTAPVVIPMSKAVTPPESQPVVAASVATPAATVPAPLQRLVPPAPVSRAAAAAAARNVTVAAPPTGATGRCKDGTYLTGAATEQACASHDGLAVAFSVRRQLPRRQ